MTAPDAAPWHVRAAPEPVPSRRRSGYVVMRDGVRIAVDVHLPAQRRHGARLPTILRQTRYYRGVQLREPARRFGIDWLLDHAAQTRAAFIAAGFAWVDVCARGSGASFGSRPCPWSPEEIRDGGEIVQWIVDQPWSNGRVGATGVSYDGTAAELLVLAGHPALQAVIPRFSLFDAYTDVAFPGGIHLAWFTQAWAAYNQALDAGQHTRAVAMALRHQLRGLRSLEHGALLRRLLAVADSQPVEDAATALLHVVSRGVTPAESDALLRHARHAHRDNFDVHAAAVAMRHRDDTGFTPSYPDESIDLFSPHRYADQLRDSGVAFYGYSGWLDAAYQHGAIKRQHNVGGRLIIGPWDHGGRQHISPACDERLSSFDHDAEMIAFFDATLRNGDAPAPNVRYYTLGEERWKEASVWPPPSTDLRLYLDGDRRLRDAPSASTGEHRYRVDPEVGTGPRSRWDCLLGLLPPVGYGDRADSRLLVFRGDPLPAALEVTGHPLVHLQIACSHEDALVFVYLEDEAPDGRVTYITEGQLRARFREPGPAPYRAVGPARAYARAIAKPLTPGEMTPLTIDLLPISYRLERGHRLRLAIAGADRDHFETLPYQPTLAVGYGGAQATYLDLPTPL